MARKFVCLKMQRVKQLLSLFMMACVTVVLLAGSTLQFRFAASTPKQIAGQIKKRNGISVR
jgi:hypothetical protein